jgi:hypothetical protein
LPPDGDVARFGDAAVVGDTRNADTRMTEKHYARLVPSYVAQAIRATFPRLDLSGETETLTIHKIGSLQLR